MASGKKYRGRPSTDGTRLGAEIAAVMGTDDEEVIRALAVGSSKEYTNARLTGMDEEQADWEAGLEDEED